MGRKNSKTVEKPPSNTSHHEDVDAHISVTRRQGGEKIILSKGIKKLPHFRKIDFTRIREFGDYKILDSLPEGIFIIDEDWKCLYANHSAARLLAKSQPELTGYSLAQFLKLKSNKLLFDNLSRCLKSGKPIQFETSLTFSQGQVGLYHLIAEPCQGGAAITIQEIIARREPNNNIQGLSHYYKALLEAEIDGIHILDDYGRVLVANEAFCRMLGYSLQEILQLTVKDWDPKWSPEEINQAIREMIKRPAIFETRHRRKDGSYYDAEITATAITLQGKNYLYAAARDITQRKRKLEAITRLNRLNAFIRQVNHLILRVRNQSGLFNEVCNIAIQTGGFRMAWIGLVDARTNMVRVETWDGYENGYLASLNNLPLSDLLLSGGPVGRSLKESIAVFSNDIASDPTMAPWREDALRRDYQSTISIPILLRERTIGVLVLYSSEKDFFTNKDEVAMLETATDNISFCLEKILTEKERYEALQDLAAGEIRYRTMVDSAPEGIIVHRLGKLLYGNPAARKIFGVSSSKEILGRSILNLVHPDFRERISHYLGTIPPLGTTIPRIEAKFLTKDGTPIDVEATGVSIIFEGAPAIQSFIHDVTEQKRAQEKLIQLSQAVEQSPVSIIITDNTGAIEYVNPKFEKVTGYRFDEIKGENPRILKSGYTTAEEYKKLWKSITAGATWHGELHNRKKNGELFWEFATISAIRNTKGELIKFLALKEDITTRKEAELKLSEMLERYELVNKATQDLIWELEIQNRKIIWNNSSGNIFGHPNSENIGNLNWSLRKIHPSDRKKVKEGILTAIDNKIDKWQEEFRFLSPDGSYRYLYARGYLMWDEMGVPVRIIGSTSDLTEKKKLENELMEQRINQQKAQMEITIKAHEDEKTELGRELHDNINQIMATIKMYLSMVNSGNEFKKDFLEKSREYVDIAMNEIRKLSHSLAPPSLGEISLEEALEELISNLNINHSLKVQLQFDELYHKKMKDKNKELALYRIVQEQLANIHKHAQAKVVKMTIKGEGENIFLSVCDDGVGFDTGKKNKGIGLKNIESRIKFFSGTIEIDSSPGKGCNLKIWLPY